MTIRIRCPGCDKMLRAKDESAGKQIKCPNCGHVVVAPASGMPSGQVTAAGASTKPPLPTREQAATATTTRPGTSVRWPYYAGGGLAFLGVLGVLTIVLMVALAGKEPTSTKHEVAAVKSPGPQPDPERASNSEPKPAPGPNGKLEPKAESVTRTKEVPAKHAEPSKKTPPPSGAPKLALKVHWQYESGSSGVVVKPHTWTLTLDLKNNDKRPWTVFPDLVFGEAVGDETLGAGLGLEYRPNMTLKYFTPPRDTSGESSEMLMVGNVFMFGHPLKRQWEHNGAPHKWEPTELKPGEALRCVWTHATGTSFKDEVKSGKDYSVFHLGPVVYDAGQPNAPAYAFTASVTGAQSSWTKEAAQLEPLTRAVLLRHMDDAAKPTAWRHHYQRWLSDQPRPLPTDEVNAIHLTVLEKRDKYPVALRMSAGRHLVFAGPAGSARILALVADRGEDSAVRCFVIDDLDYLKSDGERALLALAQDGKELVPVREAALNTLAKDRKGRHWPLIEQLHNDAQVGKKAKELVQERDKKKEGQAKKIAEIAKESKVQEQAVKAIAALEGQARLDSIAAELKKWEASIETEGGDIVKVNFHSYGKATDAGLACLQYLPQLREVNFYDVPITDAGLKALSNASQIRKLGLSETRITNAGLAHLKAMPRLESLYLHDAAITDAGLVQLQALQQLRELNLQDMDVTDKGWAALERLTELRELSLPDEITDASLAALRPMTKLEKLDLGRTQVTDAGLQHLLGLTKLSKLTLRNTAVTTQGVAKLQKALPQVEINR